MEQIIGIKEQNAHAVAVQLSKLLADEFILYTKTRNAHWNVEGTDFHSMHIFFESQYEQLDEMMDSVAERIRKIGHYAPGTVSQLVRLTHLSEYTERDNKSLSFIRELLEDHESVIEFLRGNITPFADTLHDLGSSDFITGLMEKHEEMAWMLRAHLK